MKNTIFYFIIFPFLGFINALRNYTSDWAKPTIIAFVAFFGLTMIKSDAADSSRYVQNLEMMYNNNKDFDTIQTSLYSQEGGQADIYVTLVTFIFSLFTDNGNLLFMFFGLVFGYFYANNIGLVLDQSKGKLSWEKVLLIVTFSLVIGFWTLNGVRMWTAAHIFFYGSFLYFFHNKKKGLVIAAASMLVHFSFVLPIALLLIYSVVKVNIRIFFFLYFASFFIVELNVSFIKIFLENNMPEFILPRVKSYFNEEYIETSNDVFQQTNWYIIYFQKMLSYFNLIFITILFFKIKNYMAASHKKLLGFSLFFLTVANITSLLPSGGRFLIVAFLFSSAAFFIIVATTKDSFIPYSIKIISPLLIVFCIVSIRTSMDFISIMTLTNPIIAMFTNIDVPLIDFIK